MSVQQGIVKAVLSGDTIIVMGPPKGGPPPEKTITLAGVIAPRLGRHYAKEESGMKDEPWAWESRELIRKMCVGKAVSFRVEPTKGSVSREYASVTLNETSANLAIELLRAGLARVKPQGGGRGESEDVRELSAAEAEARDAHVGVWDPSSGVSAMHVRDVKPPSAIDTEALYHAYKGQSLNAIVDSFRDAGCARVHILPSLDLVTVMLTGIQAPSIKRNEAGAEVAEPFALEAKFFVESRLLNRDVQLMLEGVDKHNNLFGTLIHPAGIISIELVKQGFARTMDWSLKMARYQPQLQAAEREAKGARLRLWKDYTPPPSSVAALSSSSREWSAKIVEVISGDLFVVRDSSVSPPIDRRVSLSSVRAPRMGGKDKQDEAWAWQSREFFREKFIGRSAKLSVDYTREVVPGDASTSRMFVTALVEGKNVAEVMAHEGLVTAQKHRTDDERSPAYDLILTAEKAALASKKNIHSTAPPPSRRPVSDVSADVSRAKQFLPFLTRDGERIKAVVEHVVNGARFKLLIPKEYCVVSFVLSGVRCPQPPRGAESPGEEFGVDALNFTRDNCLQHNVEIRVETQDRGGSFIGSLYVNGRNLSTLLLKEGLAYLGPTFYPDRVADADELQRAQEAAKAAKLRVFAKWVEPVAAADDDAAAAAPSYVGACTFVAADASMYIQKAADEDQIMAIGAAMEKYKGGFGAAAAAPRPGDMCVCLFDADGCFYRGKVLKRAGDGQFEVLYVDYGNTETVPPSHMRSIDPSLAALPPMATPYKPSFIKLPREAADALEAVAELSGLVMNRPLLIVPAHRDKSGAATAMVYDGDASIVRNLVTGHLVAVGLARVDKKSGSKAASAEASAALEAMKEEEALAHRDKVGIWRYGDCGDSDDDERRPPANAWKR